MSDEHPDYLKVFGGAPTTFDPSDGPEGNKRPKKKPESVDAQMSRIIRPMPASQRVMPLGGSGRDPDWLLRGEPRAVQLEALRRSYGGFWLREDQHDANERGYRLRDDSGLGRTGPARGWAHFMEQRLGKTPVLLNEFGLLRRDHGCRFAVVFAPPQFKAEWADEADRFGLDCPAHVFNSSDRKAAQRWVDGNRRHGGLIAINYEAALSFETLAFLETIAGNDALFALDESVSVKNDSGKLAKNVLALSKLFGWRRDLTGKPVVQGPQDLFMQLKMIGALDGINYFSFRNRFCKMGGFQGKKVMGAKNEEELFELLLNISFPARRTNWLTTPGVDYATVKVEMIPEQKVHYRRMQDDFLTEIERAGYDLLVISADQIVGKLLKLQQISSGFIIDEVGKPHDLMPAQSNPKLQRVKQMLATELQDKVIVIAHYRHSIALLMEELKEFNPCLIAGDAQMRVYDREVQAEKARFNSDPGSRVMIGQEIAIRYGHTLMGTPEDPCLSLVCYETDYNLNTRSQIEERNQGAGQVDRGTIYDLQAAPIDADIIEALKRKEDISAAVMNYARHTGVLPD